MSNVMKIRLRCFSHVKHALGCGEIELELPEGATTADAEARVREMGGAALAGLPLRAALNREYVNGPTPLSDGDEIALIPPVQGG